MNKPPKRIISRVGLQADHGQAPTAGAKVPGHMWAAHPAPATDVRPVDPVTMIAPGVLPRTIQLCIHCRQRPAGFWVRRTGGTVVRRPWCLSCCHDLDRDRYDVIQFGG
jgi:hypothetical protein